MDNKCIPDPANMAVDPLNPWCGCGKRVGKPTVSKCLNCGAFATAYNILSEDDPPRIYLVRECLACSEVAGTPRMTSACISMDASFHWLIQNDTACGCAGGQCAPIGTNAKDTNQLHTCTLLIEIVKGCNMACPTCYADSPQTKVEHCKPMDINIFKRIVTDRLNLQGEIDIIQLSGGEPTLHPQFFDIVAWLAADLRIKDILLNTNGIKLNDPDFIAQLEKVVPKGRFAVYLQFDGVTEDAQKELRDGDFRELRNRAVKNLNTIGIPICLTSVVSHSNLSSIWKTVEHSLGNPMIKWVTFQPEFLSGRNDQSKMLEQPVSVAHIIHSLAQNSGGILTGTSFMPLPCSHPNCGTIGFLVKVGGVWKPVGDIVDLSQFTNLIKDRMNFDIEMIVSGCGCDELPLDKLLKQFGIEKDDVKMIFIKPFMDDRTWDEDRIKSCCTHVADSDDGKIYSFCQYYANEKKKKSIFA